MTNPEIIKEYLFGTQTVTDWKVGSEIIFQGEFNGTTYRDKGVILENIPGELLSYSYWSGFSGTEDLPENYSTVTYKVIPKGDNVTQLQWIQKGYATEVGYLHSKDGMQAFMEQIKAIAER
jgi:uncharacterized protein YndB with AHSA1/START domain